MILHLQISLPKAYMIYGVLVMSVSSALDNVAKVKEFYVTYSADVHLIFWKEVQQNALLKVGVFSLS